MKRLYFILTLPLIVPHLICYSFTKSRKMIDAVWIRKACHR